MRILIDILHPAHVHFFRLFRQEMKKRGYEVAVAAREKEITTNLLRSYGVEHTVLSRQAPRKLGLPGELAVRTFRLLQMARKFRPDVLTGIMGPSIAPVARLLGAPSVVFYDSEHAWHTNSWVYPLAHTVCTPDCYRGGVPGRHVSYAGYHELAYLHPDRFTPDPEALGAFGLAPEIPYFLLRFVSWQAVHDAGHRGLSQQVKREIVALLEQEGRVVISSEGPVPEELAERVLRGPPENIHHVLAHAAGVVGESATMCSEAAVLGVPSIYTNSIRLGYLEEQEERYGLVRNVPPERGDEILHEVKVLPSREGTSGRARLLNDKVDVTSWMVRFFENLVGVGPP